MNNTVIKVENLSKYYKLGTINNGMLFRDIQTWIARKTGKPDPHGKIGQEYFDDTIEGFWALKNLNFKINEGDRVGIIGKNGAGKSTLLKILSRITAPTEGIIKIRGRITSLLEVGTGFHAELTGRENIYLNGAILGMKRREVTQKLDEIIAFSEIEQHIDTPVKRYSSGMYVRLAFAVAAHLDSEILIADEVLAVGDASFQKKALGKMSDLSTGQGRTVLFVSHNMSAVKQLCNCGIILEKGKLIVQDNDINKLIKSYLEPSAKMKMQKKWQNLGEFKNRFFTPESMYLINNKHEIIDSFERESSNIQLVIKGVIEDINPLLNIGFSILNNENSLIFSSWIKDIDTVNLRLSKDLNSFSIQLPANIFNIGEYKIILMAGIHHLSYIIAPSDIPPVIFFSVTGSLNLNFGDLERSGCIVPILEWRNT